MNTANVNKLGNNGGNRSNNGCGGGGGGPCGACKFLRRKCVPGCIFAPHFDAEQGSAHFAAVHKVYGASNISKLLHQVPVDKRPILVFTTCYEAQARLRDPVFGVVGYVVSLQQQLTSLQTEYNRLLATQSISAPPPFPQQQGFITPSQLSMCDLPNISSIPSTYDLSSFMFEPVTQNNWAMPTQVDSHPPPITTLPTTSVAERAPTYSAQQDFMCGELQEIASRFMIRPDGASSNGRCNGASNI